MATFFFKLIPPRPSFAEDMTEAERAFMAEHVAYWLGLSARREAVVFGAVADPKGAWGLAVLDVEDAARAEAVAEGDPAVEKGGLTYENPSDAARRRAAVTVYAAA